MAKTTNKKSKKTFKQDWNEFSGNISLYAHEGKKDGDFYLSTSLGRKNDDGDYDNYYLTVRLSRAAEEELAIDSEGVYHVAIRYGFLKPEFWTDKKSKEQRSALVLFINDAVMIEE